MNGKGGEMDAGDQGEEDIEKRGRGAQGGGYGLMESCLKASFPP